MGKVTAFDRQVVTTKQLSPMFAYVASPFLSRLDPGDPFCLTLSFCLCLLGFGFRSGYHGPYQVVLGHCEINQI